MMIKRGDAKTGTVVEAATAKEASVCSSCGRIRQASDDNKCPCQEAPAEVVAADSKEEAKA